MADLSSLFDPYSRKARLFPGLLTIFPMVITAIALFPSLLTSSIGATLLTICTSCGLLYALSVFARSRGRKSEKRLLKTWGGWPTTAWLRHGDPSLERATRQRYHTYLAAHVPGLSMPTEAEQNAGPGEADSRYASAVKWLQEQCRGRSFPLIEKENAEYGFRRNLRGMKPVGLIGAFAAFLTTVSVAAWSLTWPSGSIAAIDPVMIGAALLDLVALIAWIFVVRDDWVRDAGDQYARALLAECDVTKPANKPRAKAAKRSQQP